ncbi:14578_t:CDS:2, partial [Dentiscutata erythropus]
VSHMKQNRNWLRRRGENLKSCIENTFLSLLRNDPEVWQERERIGGYTIERRDENGGIVTYISSDLDELNEVKDNIRKITPHLLTKPSSSQPPDQIPQIDSETGPGPRTQAYYEGAENEDNAMQVVFLQCLYHNYSEEEINENLEMAVEAYRASDKGKM